MHQRSDQAHLSIALLLAVGCSSPAARSGNDAAVSDSSSGDTSLPLDTGVDSFAATDSAIPDTGARDSGADSSVIDTGVPDTGVGDGGALDTGVTDSGMRGANGASCREGSECASGECVDEVCCNTQCNGTCLSCRARDTGGADGVCAPVRDGLDPADECGTTDGCESGFCNGGGACGVLPAETVCRAAAGSCDLVEECDGRSGTCPADVVAETGTTCRAAAGACDESEVCDGLSAQCPANAFTPPSSSMCAPYRCTGGSLGCPTSCVSNANCQLGTLCVSTMCVPARRVFVTSTRHTGDLGGLAGADSICRARAMAAGITGTFRAWISSSTISASARIGHFTGPYYRLEPTGPQQIANNWTDLTDGLVFAPAMDENLSPVRSFAWTGTDHTGAPAGGNCNGWLSSSSDDNGTIGQTNAATTLWSNHSSAPCSQPHHLYCIETDTPS